MKKLTKIVLLTDCLADLAGGAEKQIFELAKGLDKNHYSVTVVSLDTWGKAPRELIESVGCHFEVFKVVRIYGLSGLLEGLRFRRFLKDNDVQVLQTYHFSSDIWGTFWGKLAGVPVIISNRRDMGFWRKGIHIQTYKLINRWVTKIIGNADSIRGMVTQEEGEPAEKIGIIYNGVELAKERPQDHSPGFTKAPGEIMIMHVANLKQVKGHIYLLRAFAAIAQEFPQARVALIGKDEYGGYLQTEAEKLGIKDKVLFLGKRSDVQHVLSSADICTLTSLSEGMSNAILEYMSASKPVIATNVGGNPELVRHGINGLLVEKENVEQIKEALITLINDPQKRRAMGDAGFKRVEADFAMPAMVGHYDKLFTDLLSKKRTRRILHLVSSGGLFGAERVILNLAACTQEAVSFVGALHNTHNPHLEVIDEAKRMGLNTAVFEARGQMDVETVARIKKFLKNEKIDLVHTHNYKSDFFGFWATRFTKTKWLGTNHVWHSTDQKLRFYETIDAILLKFADKVFAVSEEIRQGMLRKGFKDDHVIVIDNGIHINNFKIAETQGQLKQHLFNLAPGTFVVVIVGRLAKEKGHEIFLRAGKSVVAKHPNVKFLIVGDGPLMDDLQKLSTEIGMNNHVIFGGIRKDMPKIYTMCDLMVNSSYIEGLPMTLLEAMSAKLPVIATRVGAVPKVISHQRNGLSLEPGNPDTLAQAINELIEDEPKRKRFAQAAYEDVCNHFSDVRMAQRYREIYEEVIAKPALPAPKRVRGAELSMKEMLAYYHKLPNILLPRKIKILHFISSSGFFGAENVLLNIAQNFNNDQFVSFVSAIHDERSPNLEIIDHARELNLPIHIFKSKGRFDIQTVHQLHDFIVGNKIDVLHTHNYKSDIIGALAARGTGVSLISTAHGFTGVDNKVSFYERLDRWFLKHYFQRAVVVTSKMLPELPSEKKRVIENGIDFQRFAGRPSMRHEIRGRYGIKEGDVLIGTVGRLSFEKNHALLLSAARGLQANVKIMIVGNGSEEGHLRSLIKENRLEGNVIFTGLISDPAPFYQAFDIFVLSSRTEGVPLTVLEAMASKVPVIATKVGGIPKIITHGTTGLLVPSQNAPALRKALEMLISDPQQRQQIKETAYRFAKENYSLENMNWLYQKMYQEVLN